jgi:gluconate 5-dehydrogenase
MSTSLFDLTGKMALITGSGQGLGFVIARGLGKAGATIVLNDIDKDKLDKAVEILRNEGIETHGSLFNVTKKDEIEKEVRFIEEKIGPIDILFNNAGIQRRIPLEDFPESDWDDIMEINLKGVFLTSQQVVKGMISRRRGKIVNICSLQSELGRQTIAPYAASKGGVKMLTRGMAVDWGKHNIQTNGIGPGYFITEMTQKLADDPEFDAWLKARTPADRWGFPEELVGTAIFLSSEASNFINGQIIYVDGGILASI